MSQLLIGQYLNQFSSLNKVSGSQRESVLREAFKDLLKAWGRQHDLTFIPEYALDTLTKDKRYVDGALLYSLRAPFGYWEAKDTKDDLDAEIEKNYPSISGWQWTRWSAVNYADALRGQGAGEAASLSLSLAESESHAILRPVDSYP